MSMCCTNFVKPIILKFIKQKILNNIIKQGF